MLQKLLQVIKRCGSISDILLRAWYLKGQHSAVSKQDKVNTLKRDSPNKIVSAKDRQMFNDSCR